MKFIELTLTSGQPILLNPAKMESVFPATDRPNYKSVVSMGNGADIYVKEEYTDILDKVSEAVTH